MTLAVNLKDIQEACKKIRPYIRQTPLFREERLDGFTHSQVYLKPECLQITGSFKLRGALNKILSLTNEEKHKGIIAASSGNHAQGVAYTAKKLGIEATLVLPENAPSIKIKGTEALGAKVILYGFDSIQRYKKLYELVEEMGYTMVHSYDDPKLVAGQGTIGCEIMKDTDDLDVIIVPLGGGGLLAGIAVAAKEINPKIRVIGVEPEAIPRYSNSRKLGKPVEVQTKNTIADGLMIAKAGEITYPIIEKYVDEIVTVSDEFIYKSLPEVIFKTKLVVEPASVIGFAAVLAEKIKFKNDEKVCFVLSGGNIDPERLVEFINYDKEI